jgi:hypothetical protein
MEKVDGQASGGRILLKISEVFEKLLAEIAGCLDIKHPGGSLPALRGS